MPDRLVLYNTISNGYDMSSFYSYIKYVTIKKILSFSVKEDAIKYFNELSDGLKEKIRCLQ